MTSDRRSQQMEREAMGVMAWKFERKILKRRR